MALTAFTSRLGRGQGRIRPASAPPVSGEYVFVLGEDQPGRFFDLVPGDFAEVTQTADLTDAALLRATLRLRVPPGPPWEACLVIDGLAVARVRARPGRERVVTDLAANVSKRSGLHEVGVRLELVAE
jgi:hypothetical protein